MRACVRVCVRSVWCLRACASPYLPLQDIATDGKFGRLLKLGVLSFAIGDDQDAAVLRPKLQHLVDYLNATTVYFNDVRACVCLVCLLCVCLLCVCLLCVCLLCVCLLCVC